jgi:hypothetical protein
MRKLFAFAIFAVVLMGTFGSCTNDQTEDEIEFLSIDKDKQECTGCDDNGDN